VLGPLGGTFDVRADGARHLLVAGGIGVAPFPDLAKRLIAAGADPVRDLEAVLGARTARALYCQDDFAGLGVPCAVATDDGSAGFRGNAVALAAERLQAARAREPGRAVRVVGCGPEPMLRALQALCVAAGVPGQLSIDRRMACGLGICRSCVVAVADAPGAPAWHFETVCREGPIFDTATLRW
jgi:dihydroorotate dehydrogenase electron transfer subunit